MVKITKYIAEKYSLIKNKVWKKKVVRGSDDLFQSGDIFKASEEELKNILREASTRAVPNELLRHREIVRALVVNNIQNQRHIDKLDSRNQIYTLIIIILTAANIYLAVQQANYTEVSTRSERILQEQAIQRAVTTCKQSPKTSDTGLYDTTSGMPINCDQVNKEYPN